MAVVSKFRNIDEFIEWIQRRLGNPVVPVFDILEDDIIDCIYEACDEFREKASGFGNVESFYTLPISANQEIYEVSEEIMTINDVADDSLYGIHTLFSTENMMYSAGMIPPNFQSKGGGFLDWEMSMQYMEMYRTKYKSKWEVTLWELEDKVRVLPTPDQDHTLILQITRGVPKLKLYNQLWVRKYALALAQEHLGGNRTVYQGVTLPGGGELNGDAMYQRGREDKEKLMEELETTWQNPPGFYMG